MIKRLLLSITAIAASVSIAFAQAKTVSGTVKDDKGAAAAFVTVVEKGTNNATTTNDNGFYAIKVAGNDAVLMFKGVGYKDKDVAVGANSSVNVALENNAKLLGDVIVTALALKREKKELAYAVQEVKGEDLTVAKSTDALQALSGKVAGASVTTSSGDPGAGTYILLRGATSVNGNLQPLIVVDGIPINNNSNTTDPGSGFATQGVSRSNRGVDINPDDIENISVLKGPSAAGLYGSQGSNGVILITLKKGSSRSKAKGLGVSYGINGSFDFVNKLPGLSNKYLQGNGGALGTGTTSWGPLADTMYWDGVATPRDKNGSVIDATAAKNNPKAIPFKQYDNVEDFFRPGFTLNHNLELVGGTDVSSFRASFSSMSQSGIVPTTTFDRNSFSLSGESKLSEKLSFSASATYTASGGNRSQQGSNVNGIMLGLLRTPVNFDNSNGTSGFTDVSAFELADGRQRQYRTNFDNPYWTINRNKFTDDVNRLYGNLFLSYKANEWLTISNRLGVDNFTDRQKQIFAKYSAGVPAGNTWSNDITNRQIYDDLIASADKKFGKFNVGGVLGLNIQTTKALTNFTQGDGFIVPGFYDISNVSTVSVGSASNTNTRKLAQFAQLKLGYNEYLFIDAAIRRENSSTFISEFNPKGKPFYYGSVGGAFLFSEAFKLSNNVFSLGKLRASYGVAGKEPAAYSNATYYQKVTVADGWTNGISFPFNGQSAFAPSLLIDAKNLKPEFTKTTEIGIDLGFLKNRINLEATYYISKSTDVLLSVPISDATGFTNIYKNAASLENKGFEVTLGLRPIETKNFSWNIDFNISSNQNKVIALAEGIDELFLAGFTGSGVYAIPGQPYGQIRGGAYLKDNNGNLVINDDVNDAFYGFPIAKDGGENQTLGNTQPKWIGSVRNTLKYENLSFSFLFDTRQGQMMWNGTRGALYFYGRSDGTDNRGEEKVFTGVKGHYDVDGNIVHTNGGADVPGVGGTNDTKATLGQDWYQDNGGGFGAVAEPFVEDASYVKLKELALSYLVTPKILKKSPIKSIEIGLVGRNLLLFTKYTGVDPETNLTGASNGRGLDYFNNPGTRSYGFNLKFNF